MELARGAESSIVWEEVEKVIKLVTGKEGKGEEMKRKPICIAEKVRAIVREVVRQLGSSIKARHDFLEIALSK